jgi:ribonuclease BN (tRNA processing enzyme)
MRTLLDPHLVDPSGREPGLWVAVRDQRRALLFDLGELGALSPRTLLRSTHAFVTHPHMDHFAGFDHWLATAPGRRIGDVTDLRCTQANLAQFDALLAGVDLLYIECVFADEDRELARRRNHLTARQAGSVARRLRARQLQPFHFSPRYEGAEDRLREQAFGAWQGVVEPDVPV